MSTITANILEQLRNSIQVGRDNFIVRSQQFFGSQQFHHTISDVGKFAASVNERVGRQESRDNQAITGDQNEQNPSLARNEETEAPAAKQKKEEIVTKVAAAIDQDRSINKNGVNVKAEVEKAGEQIASEVENSTIGGISVALNKINEKLPNVELEDLSRYTNVQRDAAERYNMPVAAVTKQHEEEHLKAKAREEEELRQAAKLVTTGMVALGLGMAASNGNQHAATAQKYWDNLLDPDKDKGGIV